MMINIILYSEDATINIAKKAQEYFSMYDFYRTTHDAIWTKNFYLRFAPKLVSVNVFTPNTLTPHQLSEGLSYMLDGEEVFISNGKQGSSYIEKVNSSTNFDKLFAMIGV